MMFNMREFVKSGFLKAVGNMLDFWIILNAAGWNEKGVLTEDDLAEINAAITSKNAQNTAEESEIMEEQQS